MEQLRPHPLIAALSNLDKAQLVSIFLRSCLCKWMDSPWASTAENPLPFAYLDDDACAVLDGGHDFDAQQRKAVHEFISVESRETT